MARPLALRELGEDERAAVERLAPARTEAARLVERARVVWAAVQGERVDRSAVRFRLSPATGSLWRHRFNDAGPAGLEEQPRHGRPPTSTTAHVATVVATAVAKPRTRGLPCAAWTLDRLAA